MHSRTSSALTAAISFSALAEPIPDDVKADPAKYEQFVMQKMQEMEEKELTKRLSKLRGGKAGFMSRVGKGQLFKRSSSRPVFHTLSVDMSGASSEKGGTDGFSSI